MLFENLSNTQLLREAEKLSAQFELIVDRAFETLAIGQRIYEAQARLPKDEYVLSIRGALNQRGLAKEKAHLDMCYKGALIAADRHYDSPEAIDMVSFEIAN